MRPPSALLFAILSVTAAGAFAAETAPAKGPVATPAKEPAQPATTPTVKAEPSTSSPASSKSAASKDDTAVGGKSTETAAQAAAKSVDKAGTPQRFIPSEQVRADFDVSFPIDI
jgi:hypothetical protein